MSEHSVQGACIWGILEGQGSQRMKNPSAQRIKYVKICSSGQKSLTQGMRNEVQKGISQEPTGSKTEQDLEQRAVPGGV